MFILQVEQYNRQPGDKSMQHNLTILSDNHPDAEAFAQSLRKRRRWGESGIELLLLACGLLSIGTTLGIVYVLFKDALEFFASPEVTLFKFLTGTVWQPQIGEFGVLPLLTATIMITMIAMLIAVPIGLFIAIYLSEYARDNTRKWLKPTLEVLAGVPTVVYGYFALTFITPILREIFGQDVVQIYNMASAGIVMGILIIPLIASMSEDALHAVPNGLREAAYGMGATKLETSLKVVLPAALSGLAAAFIIGISRGIGETMIVAIAAGAGPNLTLNPFEGAETITGHIVRISGGDISYESLDYLSLMALALLLFLITFGLNLISQRIIKHFREEYE